MKLRVKKLHEDAVIPSYAKPGDAGLDLRSATGPDIVGVANEYAYIEYGTGIAVQIPEGFVGLLFPRSSISEKALTLANSVGVIDSGYRGEIKLRFRFDLSVLDGEKIPEDTCMYVKGEKIGQLVIVPIPVIQTEEVEELEASERGDGGFGHTGK